jgi:hypothetical protein
MTDLFVSQFMRAGYEPGDGSMDGAMLVDGEWWHPLFGCDSLQQVLDGVRNKVVLQEPAGAHQPVPVSERLPGPEDCDAEGRCWLGGEMFAPGDPTWVLGFPAWAERFPEVHRLWLPAHALPVPKGEQK